MTIAALAHGDSNALGFKVSGDVTKEDYDVLTPAVAHAVQESGTTRLLLDLTDFRWEKVNAWADDLRFSHQFHDKITKMAIVGDRKWEEHLARLCAPFYAQQAKYFATDAEAWTWLDD